MSVAPFGLRMAPELHERVKADASANNRSMNAEIVARLEASGETLRDRFAMAALTGLLAANAIYQGQTNNYAAITADAYAHADAMMAARVKS